MKEILGNIFKIQSFSLQDGSGIRDTVFMKGCNLHCYWCHNPESWIGIKQLQFWQNKCIGCGACETVCPKVKNGMTARFTEDCIQCGACTESCYAEALTQVGFQMATSELLENLRKNKSIFAQSGGGVTFSGGEPLLQPEFLLEMLLLCKEEGIHTAIETAACVQPAVLKRILPYVDMVFCDIKIMDEQKHIEATGVSNQQILDNIFYMSSQNVNLHLRTPIIPDFNNTLDDMEKIATFIEKLPHTNAIELLPFHGMCEGKYQALNKVYPAKNLKDVEKWQLEHLKEPFVSKNIEVKI